ncbi:BglG family transcription antiterminator [Planococcus sp. SE5232]|uniref:BglG family transcription antiterminator n=2 Tax=Planococcus TaxID=1372 RepID=UPI001CBF1EED|nr:BglG family transcription antiterminator [Planococcus sp. 4-30]
MVLDQRSQAILSHLSRAQSYVTVNEIMETFKISRRTIYYDIGKINDWLEAQELPAVQHVRSAGFQLDQKIAIEIPEKLGAMENWQYEYSVKERRACLVLYLLARNKPLYLEHLTEKVRVSRNTTIEDVKGLKSELGNYGLQLEFDRKSGYVISGMEENKRRAAVFYLQQFIFKQTWQGLLRRLPIIFNGQNGKTDSLAVETAEEVKKIIADSEKELGIRYTDDFLHSLSFMFLLFVRRLEQGKKIEVDPIERQVLSESKEYEAAQKIAEKLTALFQIAFPEEEVFYITKHLLSSRVQFSPMIFENDINQSDKVLLDVVTKMVTDFQKYACLLFEDRIEVERNLLLHVKTAYYRVLYGLEADISLEASIKEKYPDVFLLTKKVSKHLEKATGKSINDGELTLIAVHFGGWMEKMGIKPATRKNALVVCNTGVGTSRLLQHQLEGLFSTVDIIGCVSLRDYEEMEHQADFIISTIPLAEKEKPVFVVSPILTEAEKERLLKKVNVHLGVKAPQPNSLTVVMDIIRQHADVKDEAALKNELQYYLQQQPLKMKEVNKPDLKDLLPIAHIQCLPTVRDWQEAIRKAAQPLLQEKSITKDYIQAMIDPLLEMGPYVVISPYVAIPHARPHEGVGKLAMSLLQLKEHVPFSQNGTHPVALVIVLAAIDGDSHLKALRQLTKLLNNNKTKNQLMDAESPEEIYSVVASHSE